MINSWADLPELISYEFLEGPSCALITGLISISNSYAATELSRLTDDSMILDMFPVPQLPPEYRMEDEEEKNEQKKIDSGKFPFWKKKNSMGDIFLCPPPSVGYWDGRDHLSICFPCRADHTNFALKKLQVGKKINFLSREVLSQYIRLSFFILLH